MPSNLKVRKARHGAKHQQPQETLPRDASKTLREWHKNPRRKPLILRGARQVGKTTLVRLFCQTHKLDLIEINLESTFEIRASFEKMDPSQIVKDIELFYKCTITPKTILFIDEIQVVPLAIRFLS